MSAATTITLEEAWTALDEDTRDALIFYVADWAGRSDAEWCTATFGEGWLELEQLVDVPGGYSVDPATDELVTELHRYAAPTPPPVDVLVYLAGRP